MTSTIRGHTRPLRSSTARVLDRVAQGLSDNPFSTSANPFMDPSGTANQTGIAQPDTTSMDTGVDDSGMAPIPPTTTRPAQTPVPVATGGDDPSMTAPDPAGMVNNASFHGEEQAAPDSQLGDSHGWQDKRDGKPPSPPAGASQEYTNAYNKAYQNYSGYHPWKDLAAHPMKTFEDKFATRTGAQDSGDWEKTKPLTDAEKRKMYDDAYSPESQREEDELERKHGAFEHTHIYDPIGWDRFGPKPLPGSRAIEPGAKVRKVDDVGDPMNKFVYIEDEHGNRQSVDRKSLKRSKGSRHEAIGEHQSVNVPVRCVACGQRGEILLSSLTYEATHSCGGDLELDETEHEAALDHDWDHHLNRSECHYCGKPISYHAGSSKWNHVNSDDAASCPGPRAQPKGWLGSNGSRKTAAHVEVYHQTDHDHMFEPYSDAARSGLKKVFEYDDPGGADPERAYAILNSSPGELFGAARDVPDVVADYRAGRNRSLSVGDVVVIDGTPHAVDRFGFADAPGFTAMRKRADEYDIPEHYGEQQICKNCDLDIAWLGPLHERSDLPGALTGGWTDRGGGHYCDEGGGARWDQDGIPIPMPHTLHQPYGTHGAPMTSSRRVAKFAVGDQVARKANGAQGKVTRVDDLSGGGQLLYVAWNDPETDAFDPQVSYGTMVAPYEVTKVGARHTAGDAGWVVIQRGTFVESEGPFKTQQEAQAAADRLNEQYHTNEYLPTQVGESSIGRSYSTSSRHTAAGPGYYVIRNNQALSGPYATPSEAYQQLDQNKGDAVEYLKTGDDVEGQGPTESFPNPSGYDPASDDRGRFPGGSAIPYASPSFWAKRAKIREITASVLATNPGMDKAKAREIARETVARYPSVAGKATKRAAGENVDTSWNAIERAYPSEDRRLDGSAWPTPEEGQARLLAARIADPSISTDEWRALRARLAELLGSNEAFYMYLDAAYADRRRRGLPVSTFGDGV